MEENALLAIIFAFLAVFVVLFLLGIIMYIFQAIGLFNIAKKEGRQDLAWLAWIPIVNTFLMMILLERAVHDGVRGRLTLFYGIAVAASFVLGSWLPFVGIIPAVIFYYAFYFMAKRYSTNPVFHLVIAIITFGFATGIQLFMFRNRDVVDPTGLDIAATNGVDISE